MDAQAGRVYSYIRSAVQKDGKRPRGGEISMALGLSSVEVTQCIQRLKDAHWLPTSDYSDMARVPVGTIGEVVDEVDGVFRDGP